MKIAYLFAGHTRTWNICYQNFFSNIYNILPGDIFIHTWDRVNAGTTSWWNHWNKPLRPRFKKISSKTPDIDAIKSAYNPKEIIVESDPSWDEIPNKWAIEKYQNHKRFNHIQTNSRFAVKYALYSIKTVFDIAKQYDKYDRFFCSRLDLNFISSLDPKEFENPNLVLSKTQMSSDTFRQDIFFHGNESYVQTRASLYDNIESYWYDHDYIEIEFEHALTNYLKDKNIPISESNLKFNIPRINGRTSQF